ncbi:MAG: hypothetical protein AAB921_01840, partial [Patescibacteria group bacterium]
GGLARIVLGMSDIAIDDLKEKGRVYVPYPTDLREGVEEAVAAWKAFCELPVEQKQKFVYSGDLNISGNGYELKLNDARADLKEDFHLRVSVADWLREQALLVDPTVTIHFVNTALKLNGLMTDTLRSFAEAVEQRYKIEGFADDVMARQPQWLLRFLHYFGGREPGDEFAAPHVDKGGFTLHLYESNDGVESLSFDTKEWQSLPLAHDETVFFAGMGLQQRAECELRALCHRVIATPETAENGRYSAVAFIGFEHARYWDKEKHGRMQDWAPGAFYDMPFTELNQYFVD